MAPPRMIPSTGGIRPHLKYTMAAPALLISLLIKLLLILNRLMILKTIPRLSQGPR